MAIYELCGYCGDKVAGCTCNEEKEPELDNCTFCNHEPCRCDNDYKAMKEADL